MSFQS